MERAEQNYLGNGIAFPLTRGGGDFESLFGEDLVFSSVPYILLTRSDGPNTQGEQPWDTGFGSQLERLKHSTLDQESLQAFAKHFIVDALLENEPRLLVDFVEITKNEREINLELYLSILGEDVDANDVRIQPSTLFSFSLPF